MPKAEITRQLEIGRRTVYKLGRGGGAGPRCGQQAVKYGPKPRRPSKLDPYKGIMDARLAEYPKLNAIRLFNEVRRRAMGTATGR